MDEKKPNILCIASLIQKNNAEEAETVHHYTYLLELIDESDLEDTDKERLKAEIKEIIADELDHQEKLGQLYQDLTGLVPKE